MDDSEAHRHACEVRYCVLRGRGWTRRYLFGDPEGSAPSVASRRGAPAAERLWRDVVALVKARALAEVSDGDD